MDFEAYIRWLMGGGEAWGPQDPYAPSLPQASSIPGMVAPFDPADLQEQARALNIAQDYADIGSDPAFLGGFYGEMPTESMYEFEANPGYTMLSNALGMEGTVEQLIADEILNNNGSAGSALTKIRQLYETNPELAPVPVYTDEYGETLPDFNYVQDVATKFQDAYLTDPTPGQPGTQTPMSGSLAEWYAKTGTPLPDQRYTPDDLATPEQLDLMANLPQYMAEADAQREAMARLVGWDQSVDPAEIARNRETAMTQASDINAQRNDGYTDIRRSAAMDPPSQAAFDVGDAGQGPIFALGDLLDMGELSESVANMFRGDGRPRSEQQRPVRSGGSSQSPVGRQPGRDPNRNFSSDGGVATGRQPRRPMAAPVEPQGIQAPGGTTQPGIQAPEISQRAKTQARQQQYRKMMEGFTNSPSTRAVADSGMAWAEMAQRELDSDRQRKEREQIAYILGQQGHTPYNDTMNTRRMMSQYMGIGR